MGIDMAVIREKFATQVDSDLVAAVRQLAHDEGRQIQAIVEDALREHLTAQDNTKARGRDYVWLAYLKSTERFPGLYKKLAQ
jgi:hypothetical protein